MAKVEDFTIRERNVLTLPRGIREESHLVAGVHGKAVSFGRGVVVLVTDPSLVEGMIEHFNTWFREKVALDPWAALNTALAEGRLEPAPTERYVATPEKDQSLDVERIVAQFGDDPHVDHVKRRWRE